MIWLLALLLYLVAAPAHAQGCGPQNPNCIVPLRPPTDNSNAAASTAWVRANGGGSPGGVAGDVQVNVGGTTLGGVSLPANSLLGALVAATPSALSVPQCTAAGNALQFNQGGGFLCTAVGGSGTPGGTNGQIQYNNSGAFGGFTMSGDCTITTGGVITCNKSVTIASGTAALGTSLINSGACATAVTVAATGVATTDTLQASFNSDPTGVLGYQPSVNGMLVVIPYPTANNVNFRVCNNTSSGITPGAITLNWRVVR